MLPYRCIFTPSHQSAEFPWYYYYSTCKESKTFIFSRVREKIPSLLTLPPRDKPWSKQHIFSSWPRTAIFWSRCNEKGVTKKYKKVLTHVGMASYDTPLSHDSSPHTVSRHWQERGRRTCVSCALYRDRRWLSMSSSCSMQPSFRQLWNEKELLAKKKSMFL